MVALFRRKASDAAPESRLAKAMSVLESPVSRRADGKPATFRNAFSNYRKAESSFAEICKLKLGSSKDENSPFTIGFKALDSNYAISANIDEAFSKLNEEKPYLDNALRLLEQRACEIKLDYPKKTPFLYKFLKKPQSYREAVLNVGLLGACTSMSGVIGMVISIVSDIAVSLFAPSLFAPVHHASDILYYSALAVASTGIALISSLLVLPEKFAAWARVG